MSSLLERNKETVRHERVISSLRNRTGAPLVEVRRLFAQEFSRLELRAKVRSYLSVLTASNVRNILRLTDKAKTSCGESVHGSLAETSGTTLHQRLHADSSGLESDAASASSPIHAEPAAAGFPTDRNEEVTRQAARLATWEDEGGTTAFIE